MKSMLIATLATILATGAPSNEGERQLKAAMNAELVNGDLKTAIRQFGEIAAKFRSDRSVAAMALLRMAMAYQKLGDAESRKIFERVAREFSDQRDVAGQAQARLAALRPKPASQNGIANRKLLTVPDGGSIEGRISPDGRYVPYVNYKDGGNLYLHDLVSGINRQLTNTGTDGLKRPPGVEYQCAHEHAFSRDGKRLVYSWHLGGTRFELRVIPLQGSGIPAFRTLFAHEDLEWVMPHDWSPDGKWIAVQLQRKDKVAQIGLVGTEDGSLRVLKSVDWRGPNSMAFSPDGQFLAYDLPAGETTLQRDMYVLAVDGSREIPAEVHPADDTLLGWAPDGRRLLFASDRSGGTDLWARRFSEGKMQGSPEMLKRDIGRFDSMGITSSGSLHYSVSSFKPSDVMTAEFDFGKGDYASAPVQAVSTYVGTNESPEWSRDGKYLAWISRRKSHGAFHFVIGFRSLENGQVRELLLPPNFYLLAGAPFCWSHDGTSFLIGGQDKGRSGIFRVDRESGHTSLLVDVQSLPAVAVESADGQNLYYWSGWSDSGEVALFKRVLATAVDTVLLKGKYGPFLSVSADGRYLAVHETPRPRTPQAIILVPTDGSTPRELIRTTGPDRTGFLAWLPDRESVLIAKVTEGGKTERWRIPFDGGEPKRLDMKNQLPGFFKLHPDGRQVAFPVPGPAKPPEVWVLENFLPATAANR